jgi:hypothetical protein
MYSSTSKLLLTTLLALLLCAPALAEGAASDEAPKGLNVPLRDRAQAYWEARASRTARVMEFYAPVEKGGPRRSRDVSEFGNVQFKKFEITEVIEEEDTGTVMLEVEPDLRALPIPAHLRSKIGTQMLSEVWLRIDGVWYKKPVPRGFSSQKEEPDAQGASGPAEEATPDDAQPTARAD